MKDWMVEDKGGSILVLCGEAYDRHKKIYPEDGDKSKVDFYLLYNELNKTVGYCLTYKYEENYPKFLTYNAFGILYNKKNIPTFTFEVIFEDSIVRLLKFQHKHGINDYFLVGRWRDDITQEKIGDGNG